MSFAPKYLESQFGLTASKASLIAGAVGEYVWCTLSMFIGYLFFFSGVGGGGEMDASMSAK